MKKLFAVLMLLAFAVATFAQTPHSVTLSCTASTSAGVTSYNVYRAPCNGTVSGGACSSEGAFALIGSSPSCSYTDATVKALQKYSYEVTAVCPTCSPSESAPSNHIAVTIPADGQPNPPTNLTAPTVALLQLPGGKTSVTAKWQDSAPTTTYKLTGTRQLLWWKWDVTVAQGSKRSTTGTYSLIWTGSRVASVVLEVCDLSGCQTKSAS